MDRIEPLVQVLYQPGAPSSLVEQAQRELLVAQKSPHGWDLALAMLNSPNANTQFLGAQTLLVKLNTGDDLPTAEVQRANWLEVLSNAIHRALAPFVVRKLLVIGSKLVRSGDWIEGVAQTLERIGNASSYRYDFLDSLVEDSELSPAALRRQLGPTVPTLVLTLISGSNFGNLRALKTLEVYTTVFFDEFSSVLDQLISAVAPHCAVSDEWRVAALQTIKNLYSTESRRWPTSLQIRVSEMLQNWVQTVYQSTPADFYEDDQFIAVSELVITYSLENFGDLSLHRFIANLAQGNNLPVVEDPLAFECVGFWNQYVEEVIGNGMSSEANSRILEVIANYWPRIRLYNGLKTSDWDEFASFRTDFGDFLELAYPLIGLDLFAHLTNLVLQNLGSNDWFGIESALFGLNALADIIGDDYRGERPEFRQVQQIFTSELWLRLPQCDNFRVKQTAVTLIGSFVDFFLTLEGQPHLAVTLNYLFGCLKEPQLQPSASKSVQKLCDGCRPALTSEISAFVAVYAQIRSILSDAPHIRTLLAISNVIQAQTNLAVKTEAVYTLLNLALSTEFAGKTELESRQQQVRCVAAIARGVKECEVSNDPDLVAVREFWHQNEHAQLITATIQRLIASAYESADLSLVEATCDVVKAGMSEVAGPFVLPEGLVLEFVQAKVVIGPETVITPILELARFLVMSLRASKPGLLTAQMVGSSLLPMLDREFSVFVLSSVLDLLTQLVLLASTLDVPLASLGSLAGLRHAYSGLLLSDRFVLKSATLFWKEFITNNGLSSEQASQLVPTLVQQIANQSSRTELPAFVDVLKHLVAKQPLVTAELLKLHIVEQPLVVNLARLDRKARSDFVAQLMLLKGGRRTFDVCQKFWQLCRNIPSGYDPVVVLD